MEAALNDVGQRDIDLVVVDESTRGHPSVEPALLAGELHAAARSFEPKR